jgi:excisionase family DNA binding protein
VTVKLLTVEQLCELLQVKKDWVYDHVRAGDIPFVRVGNLLRFREDRINEWLEASSSNSVV